MTISQHYEFRIGDCVQFKEWDELVEEFGVDEDGNIPAPGFFNKKMEYLCGQIVHIKSFKSNGNFFRTEEKVEHGREGNFNFDWNLNVSFIKPYEDDQQTDEVPVSDWEHIIFVG